MTCCRIHVKLFQVTYNDYQVFLSIMLSPGASEPVKKETTALQQWLHDIENMCFPILIL